MKAAVSLGLGALLVSTWLGCGSSESAGIYPLTNGGADGGGDGDTVTPTGDADTDVPMDAGPTTHATGTLGAWQTLAPLPTPRANHCSVAVSGFLLVIGGNFKTDAGFVSTDEIHAAKINADGSLGAWKLAGKTPSPVNACTVANHGSTLLLLDGLFDNATDQSQVWSADVSAAGDIAAWKSLGALPANVRLLTTDAWVDGRTLFAMDSRLPNDGDAIVQFRTPLGGALAWAESSWLPGFRGRPQYAHAKSFVYTLGGYSSADAGNQVLTDVNGAPRSADGSIGKPFATRPLAKPRSFGTATAVDDWIFLIGGKDAIFTASGATDAYASQIAQDGTLGEWVVQFSLPKGRTNHAVALGGDFLYITGGGFDAGGLDTVFAAKVRY